jgi:iron complex outermembrane recepter protein
LHRTGLFSATALGALCAVVAPALAAPSIAFSIEAEALGDALLVYAAQSGRQVLFNASQVAGKTSPTIRGEMSAEAALDLLLAGSGLSAELTGSNSFVLRPAPGPARTDPPRDPGAPHARGREAGEALAPVLDDAPSIFAVDPPAVLDELIITGSLIRGPNAPTSPVLLMDRDDIDRLGAPTVADMLAALPQNFGGAGSPDSAILGTDGRNTNDLASTGVNLRGLGASATLVLVNGRRMGGTGTKGDFADVSAVPTAAIERVDVLLDGASALYGSDAVGGVVNILLKRRFEGAETRLRLGGATQGGGEEVQAAHTFGKSWDDGDLVVSYEYGKRWGLKASDRPFTANADLRSLGGTDHRVIYAYPANILVLDPATNAYVAGWSVPPGQDGLGLEPSDFLVGAPNLQNQRQGGDVLPRDERQGIYVSLTQEVTQRLRFVGDVRYNQRRNVIDRPSPISAFVISRANPFFVSPNGSTSHTMGYSFFDEVGPQASRGSSKSLGISGGFEIDLPRRWRGDVYAAMASELGERDSGGIINTRFLNEALGAIPDDPTTPWSAARDGYFNPYGDFALANSRELLGFLASGYSRTRNYSVVQTFDAKMDGPLLELPGGEVKAAIGVQARKERFKPQATNLVATSTPVRTGGETFRRQIEGAFLEVQVPLIGEAMGVPGVKRLEATLAGRIERYGDFGTTTNPKVGLLWAPIESLTLRTSYGTSFRAPNMPELYQLANSSPVLSPTPGGQVVSLLMSGGNRELEPETAKTWSAGFDYVSRSDPDLRLSATWFDVEFTDQIGTPVLTDTANALTNPALAPFVTFVDPANPEDLASIRALMAASTSANIGLFPAEAYRAIIDARFVNTGSVRVRGIDASASYGFDLAEHRFDLSAAFSYLIDFERRFTPTAPVTDALNLPGQPVDLRGRVSAAWRRGDYGASLALNYVDDYRSERGRKIDAWTTTDLQLRWTPQAPDGPLSGLGLALNVQNLLDIAPPFYDGPTGIGYDPANADPLGRYVSLQLTKRW